MLRNDKKRSIFAPAKENNSMHLESESSLKDQKNDSVYQKIYELEQNHFETFEGYVVNDKLKQTTTKSLILAQDERQRQA